MKTLNKKFLANILTLIVLVMISACSKSYLDVTIPKKAAAAIVTITDVKVIDNQFVITGQNLNGVTSFIIKDGGVETPRFLKC